MRLNLTFTRSAAACLRVALALQKRDEEVLYLDDDFSMGPLDERRAEAFWQRVQAWRGTLVLWMSANCGIELCGTLAVVARVSPEVPIDIVDVATVDFGGMPLAEHLAFSIVQVTRIVACNLVGHAAPLTDIRRAAMRKEWARLVRENAALRVLTEAGLRSASIDHFDGVLRSTLTDEWQPCGSILESVLLQLWSGPVVAFHSDEFLFTRLLQLIEQGEIEGEANGAAWSLTTSRVRRA